MSTVSEWFNYVEINSHASDVTCSYVPYSGNLLWEEIFTNHTKIKRFPINSQYMVLCTKYNGYVDLVFKLPYNNYGKTFESKNTHG